MPVDLFQNNEPRDLFGGRDLFAEDEMQIGTAIKSAAVSTARGLFAGTVDVGDSFESASKYVANRFGIGMEDDKPVKLRPEGKLAQMRQRSDIATRDDPYRKRREKAVSELPSIDEIGEPPESIKGKNVVDNPEILKDPDWWAYNTSRMIPSLATSIVPAAKAKKSIMVAGKALEMTPKVIKRVATLGAAITGGTIGGGIEASSTYKEQLEQTGDEQEAARAAELMFFFTAGLNALSTGKILDTAGKTFLSKIGKAGLAAGVEAVTEGAEEPAEVTAKLGAKLITGKELPKDIKDQYVQSLKDALTVAPVAALTGGGAATINQFTGGPNAPEIETIKEPELPPGVPEFKNTNEAVAFGEKATPEQIDALQSEWDANKQEIDKLKEAKDFTDKRENAVYRGQFLREALEASRGEHPSQAPIDPGGAEYISADRRKGMPRGKERRVNIAQRQEMENWTPEQIAGFRSARESIKETLGSQKGESEAYNDILNKGAEIIEGLPEAKNKAREAMERSSNEFIYWIADKNHPFQSIQKRLNKVTEDIDVFMKETQRPKVTAAKVKQAWDEDVKPFIEKTAKSKKTLNEVEEYAHAMHAQEANKALRLSNSKRYYDAALEILEGENKSNAKLEVQEATEPIQWSIALDKAFQKYPELSDLKKQWDKFSEKPSGMTDEEAAKIIESRKNDKEIENLRKMLSDINRKRLDILNEAGLIPEEEYEIIRDKYDYYVPLMREGYDDALYGSSRGLKPSGKPIKTRGGSARGVVNIVANSVANLEKAINMAEKARSTRTLYDLVKQNPNPDFWRIKEVKKSPRHDAYGNIRMYPNLFDVSDNEFRFMVDGKQHLLEVDRDNRDAMLMIRTLKSDDASMGWFLNQFARMNRILARINTSWSPEFIVSNFIRDFQTAGINLNDTEVKGKKFFSGTNKAVRAIWRTERGKQSGSEYEKMYDRFKMAGGKIGWSDVHQTVENLSKKISREIEMESGKRPIRKTVKEWGDFIESANTSVENGVRLHVFKLAVDQGLSDEKAAQIASDLTVDFTKKGAAGPIINSLYLFANAGIQGSYRIIRAGAKSKKVRRIMAGVVAAGFLNGLLNSWAGEDDDGEDYFNKIDDFERERNAIFMMPGTQGKYAKLPLPWGYNFFWNLGVESSRAFTKEKYDSMNGAGRLTSIFFDAFNPVASGTLLQTLAPTIADPFVQVGENKTWYGGELMPEPNKFAKVPTPDSQRYWKSARKSSRWVSEKLNELTGGDKVKSGAIDISPETLDMIADTAGGSAARFFTDIGAIPIKIAKKEKIEMRKMPFIRRVAGEQSEWTNSRIYHENLQDVLTAKERLKTYKGTPQYDEIFSETKKQRRLFNTAQSTEKLLRKLRKQLKLAKAKNNKESQENIKNRMEKLYINFNKKYNKINE